MSWLVFTYSLSAAQRSSPRVTIWRRLNRLGAISPRGGVHILPAREDCTESFQWLAQEVHQLKGDCLVMKVESFEGLTDQQLIDLFRESSDRAYGELAASVAGLEETASGKIPNEQRLRLHTEIEKLRKQHAEVARTDFFGATAGPRIAADLTKIERTLFGKSTSHQRIAKVKVSRYKNKRWLTRPRPHVDRLACAWLIRKFIDPKAKIRYGVDPDSEELAFDMKEGGAFGHVGNLCTFETMVSAFDLKQPGLRTIAEIVHEIDIRDSLYLHPETAGVDAVLKGWLLADLTDSELELHGIALFDGLYADVLRKEKSSKSSSKAHRRNGR